MAMDRSGVKICSLSKTGRLFTRVSIAFLLIVVLYFLCGTSITLATPKDSYPVDPNSQPIEPIPSTIPGGPTHRMRRKPSTTSEPNLHVLKDLTISYNNITRTLNLLIPNQLSTSQYTAIPEPVIAKHQICGIDVTNCFIQSLSRINAKLSGQKTLIDSMGTVTFLDKNGINMDFQIITPPGCICPTPRCEGSVTLAGYCVYKNTTNNILYGFVARKIGAWFNTAIAGGHWHEFSKWLGDHSSVPLDPDEAQAAYAVGYTLGEANPDGVITEEALKNAMEKTFIKPTLSIKYKSAISLLTMFHMPCLPCQEKVTNCNLREHGGQVNKDFSQWPWEISQ